jgi:hypothetical protein
VKLEVWRYHSRIPELEGAYNALKDQPLQSILSTLAVSKGIPLLALCYLIEPMIGPSEELEAAKERFKEFYHYTEIELEH